jgi:hypothetical protein
MQTITYELGTLLRRVRSNLYAIPQFQRDFVWTDSQVKLLVDSLARNYPVGSLLVLAKSSEVQLQSRSVEASIVNDDPDYIDNPDESGQEIHYVLDGQQRLTSIARVFLNANSSKNYYFDLRKIYEGFDDEETAWVVVRQKGKNDPDRKDNNRLLRADIVLDQRKTDIYVTEYIEDSGDISKLIDNRPAQREAAARIKGIFEVIRKYQVPIVMLDRDAPLESVCRVFETINSTGTRLTTFDLAVAKFFPEPDLREFWNETKQQCPELSDFDVNGERVLQVLALWDAKINNRALDPTRSVLLSLDRNFISKNWQTAAKSLSNAYKWASRNGATPTNLPNHGILAVIATFNIVCSDFANKPMSSWQAVLKRWYFSKILEPGAKQASNYRIGKDFTMLVKYAEDDIPLEFPVIHLNVERLIQINKPTDTRYKSLQCIMATTATVDLVDGSILDKDLEDHHIFPRSLRKKIDKSDPALKNIESIVNKLIISKATNRNLSDKLPNDYFSELQTMAKENGIIPDISKRLRDCLIPGDLESLSFSRQFELANFNIFLENRAELLLQKVQEVIGDSLKASDDPDEEMS